MRNPFAVSKWKAVWLAVIWASVGLVLMSVCSGSLTGSGLTPSGFTCGCIPLLCGVAYAGIAFHKIQRDKELLETSRTQFDLQRSQQARIDAPPPESNPGSHGLPTSFN